MSRKLILALVVTLATAALAAAPASAKPGNGGNHNGGNHNGGHKGGHGQHSHSGHKHHHGHRHFTRLYIDGRYYVRPVGYIAPVAVAGPCTCLTKEYTPEGVVVFKDLCTKEMASAPVAGSTQSSEAQSPQNFAGKTFQDFQAAKSEQN